MNDGQAQAPHAERGTRAILDALAEGDPNDLLTLRDLLSGLGRRAFGMLAFVCVLPAFIPIPIGGAISGPLLMFIGVQIAIGLRKPWLPEFIGKRGVHRHAIAKFDKRLSPVLSRLEKVVRPRMAWILDSRIAGLVTGVLLVLLGFLLSLPIPLTNYLFGFTLLAFALALLERDGALMLAAWVVGIVAAALSWNLAVQAAHGLDLLI
ncbi:exopolysaccharide synthesis protein ExoD [Lysobacter dokdonensis DS-58]|uniref:Exopolysaccharide synthesis protein ExoD n=1 Tax=Lysobacter dokdonensis DS-58 TaxID=1300345 RepID=A0A0A2WFJ6_9GAMM|nr:exopolysaccharide biosynthesis protein [Lysobacter dokdonensis]KGQ18523.1 exopolysaccharide synthesis protein ExoD [Lysobacter dokdonensis DS-58]